MSWQQFMMETEFAGNALWRIAALFAAVLIGFILGKIGRYMLLSAAARLDSTPRFLTAAFFRSLAASLGFIAFALGLKIGFKFLVLNGRETFIATTGNILIICSLGLLIYFMVDMVEAWLRHLASKTVSKMDDMLVPIACKSLRVIVVILVLLQVATVLSDKPVTSLLAGLGIGGLALALAAQETIKNFFGSLVIFADKPFELGDYIKVDSHEGPVEQVGFRSTRIRTMDGHIVVIPNGELANKVVTNVSKRPHLRRVLDLTLTYDTPPAKLQQAMSIVQGILKDHEGLRPDLPPRVYFTDFTPDALNIRAIYWYHTIDYWAFCAFNQRVNLAILDQFNRAGIAFAFPTRTVHLVDTTKALAAALQGAAPAPGATQSLQHSPN